MEVQSVVFRKSDFTLKQAKQWLKAKGYHTTFQGKGVDETLNTYRFRQREPIRKRAKYRSIEPVPGVVLILMKRY